MRISVEHRIEYGFSAPVYLEPHAIRLRPREDASQRLREFSLEIEPAPAGRWTAIDQDGNSVTHAWFENLTERLTLRTRFEVETLRDNPFDFLIQPGDSHLPVQYPEASRGVLGAYLAAESDRDVAAFAQELAAGCGGGTMAFLDALNRALCDRTKQVVRRDGPPYPPGQTLALREGSCRDAAVLFCAACRSAGIAARFVSGYELGAALAEDGGELHAWAEVYLESSGWRGYDPSRGLAVTNAHVPIAAAADAASANPAIGTYRGAAESRLEYSISMEIG